MNSLFSFLPQFSVWQFAAAGAVCAAGPIIIHLLNRRRYRVVHWAAMDFLREALARNRRIMQIRDLLLLLLRTAAVLLFGLAIARPFWSAQDEKFDGSRPLHVVMLFDNSLSMGLESLGGTLLDRAKQRADEFLDRLPPGSRVSVVPLCGSSGGYSPDAYTVDDARDAIRRIEVVDRSAGVARAMNEARRALDNGPPLAGRIVLLGDGQKQNWSDVAGPDLFAGLPSVQVVNVSNEPAENSWVADLRVEDGLADVETPATLVAVLRHDGAEPRRDLQVTLNVDGVDIATKTVTLEPGGASREVSFTHVFNGYQPEAGRPAMAPVRVSIAPDRLPADDERHLVVPVVAALPVVFVDQFGAAREDVVQGRVGETRHVRKLLAPGIGGDLQSGPAGASSSGTSGLEASSTRRALIEIRHVTVDRLDRELLADARLVVIAGVSSPSSRETTQLLREYVEQGGQLLIAAGAEFDATAWNDLAWTDDEGRPGGGVLPLPLDPAPIGSLPQDATGVLRPMFVDFDSLGSNPYFILADVAEQELRDLYAEPLFFKAVGVLYDEATRDELRSAEIARRQEIATFLDESSARSAEYAKSETQGGVDDAMRRQQEEDLRRRESLSPAWLAWQSADANEWDALAAAEPDARESIIAGQADDAMPRVAARLTDDAATPLLIERRIGRGTSILFTTGLYSDWNTLPRTNAFLVVDRILRSRIRESLSPRNFAPADRIDLPLPTAHRDITLTLFRPDRPDAPEALDAGFIGRDRRGVAIQHPLARGLYRIVATSTESDLNAGASRFVSSASESAGDDDGSDEEGGDASTASGDAKSPRTNAPGPTLWEMSLAVNGDDDESDLSPLDAAFFSERVGDANVRQVSGDESISLAGSQMRGQDAWKWLVAVVLGVLLVEMLILSRPIGASGSATTTNGSAASGTSSKSTSENVRAASATNDPRQFEHASAGRGDR